MTESESTTRRTSSRAIKWIALVAIVALVAIIVIPRIDFTGDEDSGTAGKEPSGPRGAPPKVAVQIVEQRTTEAPITVPGTLLPNEQVEITSEVPAKVESISFREGSYVKKGSVLVRLDDDELQASLAKAKSRLKYAELNEQRKSQLLERNGVSESEYEIALSELETARADIALLEEQIDQRTIRAPFSGQIGLRQVSIGQYVTPSTVIAHLNDLNPIKIEFNVPETYANRMVNGLRFSFTVDGIDGSRTATVYAVQPGVDPETRTLRVRATTPNPGRTLLPGLFASVAMPTGASEARPTVPTHSIVPTQGGKQVYLVRDGKAVPTDVEIGLRSDTYVEITSGIRAGDTVIVEGIQSVRPGAPVSPVLQQPDGGA